MIQAFPPSNGGGQAAVQQLESQNTPLALPGYTLQHQQQSQAMTDSPPPQYHPPSAEQANSNDMEVDSVGSDTRSRRGTSVISMDDIEAAQALEGLRSGTTIFPCQPTVFLYFLFRSLCLTDAVINQNTRILLLLQGLLITPPLKPRKPQSQSRCYPLSHHTHCFRPQSTAPCQSIHRPKHTLPSSDTAPSSLSGTLAPKF